MYVKLAYKFEVITDALNGTFVEEIVDLLGSSTSGKGVTIYEVNTNVEMMAEKIVKSYPSSVTLMSYIRASLRQTYIKKLDKTSKDEAVWKKTEETFQDLLQKNMVLTLENTQVVFEETQLLCDLLPFKSFYGPSY